MRSKNSGPMLLARGEAHFACAQFEAAVDCFDRAEASSEIDDQARARARSLALDARVDLGRRCLNAGQFTPAGREFDRILARDPERAAPRWGRARLYERAGRVEEALEELCVLDEAGLRSVSSSLLEASCRVQLGDADGFRAVMTRAATIAAEHPCGIASGQMEALLDIRGPSPRPIDAIGRFRRSVSARPADAARRLILAELLLDAGWVEEAELHLAVARAADPDDIRAMMLAGRACLERRDLSGARDRFERAAGRRARYADLWLWIGLVRLHAREFSGASEAFDRSLELNRGYSGAWQALALSRFLAGETRAAARATRQMTLRHRERPAYSGSFYRALAEHPDDEALRELRRAAALHPGYADIAGALADAEDSRARGARAQVAREAFDEGGAAESRWERRAGGASASLR